MEKTIGLAVSLVGVIGTLIFVVKFLPAFMFTFQGNYANATDIIINVGVEEIISEVYWAIIVAIVSPIIGFFIYLLRK